MEKLVVMCQGTEVNLELMKQEAETRGLNMYGAYGGCLPLSQAAAADANASGALYDAPAAEDSVSDSDADSIISDAESSAEISES